uniref:Uncharacterized protein n=1 Tax=Branchiostoma floridae TaxID=7739 RepID=C3XPK8_BRAFL|eukprot:XP_002613870.1 hypothetical protein BRAFLDRAFT_72010 [Branchiostoma floridae]
MAREEDDTVECGVACYHPRWARRLANAKLFCVVWCLTIFTQSVAGVGLLTAVLSTIETRCYCTCRFDTVANEVSDDQVHSNIGIQYSSKLRVDIEHQRYYRFQLESKDLGMIASAADIGSALGLVWLSYYGGRPGVNRPKILGICMLIFTVGTFAFGLPHFMTPAYDVASGAAANGTQKTNKVRSYKLEMLHFQI